MVAINSDTLKIKATIIYAMYWFVISSVENAIEIVHQNPYELMNKTVS